MNFPIYGQGQTISATDTSAAHQLTGLNAASARDVMIYNPGPHDVHVRAGQAGVVADGTCMPILAGEKGAYAKGPYVYLAVISPDGAQDIQVFVGEGA